MIIRIVRMHFTKPGVATFLEIFKLNQDRIRGFEGCTQLELLRDLDNEYTFTTLSHWKNAESLERYRESALFASVWGKVKVLFSERPEAFSLVANQW